jgi:hypothetical protein
MKQRPGGPSVLSAPGLEIQSKNVIRGARDRARVRLVARALGACERQRGPKPLRLVCGTWNIQLPQRGRAPNTSMKEDQNRLDGDARP